MFVVDTNLLVYAAHEEARDHAESLALLETWRADSRPWFATWAIVYEFLRVTTHRAILERPFRFEEAWRFIDVLLQAPSFGLLTQTDRHPQIVRELAALHPRAAGNLMHDLHTAALMREHGVSEIRTADAHFHQFKFLRVVNPLM